MKKKKSSKQAQETDTVQVIIETPRGCRNKYKYDEDSGRLKLSKVMPEGMMFPYDFGFVPETEADDGDPIDVLVLTDEPLHPGCELECRLIGVIKGLQKEREQQENRNDRIIAVARTSVLYADVNDLSDLSPALMKQIEAFFINYQKVRNIKYKIVGVEGPRSAYQLVAQASSQKKKAA